MEAASSEAEAESMAPSRVSVRGKTDPAWEYGLLPTVGKNAGKIVCTFCDHAVGGGGINRFKMHLAGVSGNVKKCIEVPKDVREAMLKHVNDSAKKTKTIAAQKRSFSNLARHDGCSEDDSVDALTPRSTNESDPIRAPNRCPKPGSSLRQPEIKNALRGKDAALRTDHMIARFWYEHCVPFNVVSSPSFPVLMNAIASMGAGYTDVTRLAKSASKITVFVYNHGLLLSWLRKRDTWKEIVRPGATRFATTFPTLNSIGNQRGDLEALMVSEFCRESTFAKTEIGKMVKTNILDETFWDECSFIVDLTEPIIRLLHIIDSDEMPALGNVYEGYRRVEKDVMKVCGNSEIRARPYKTILGRRWERNLDRKLIKAAYYLNPRFAYSDDWEGMTRDVHSSVLDLIECPDFVANEEEALAEKIIYDKREKMFARSSAKKTACIHDPSAWVEEPTPDLEIDSLEAALDEEDDYSHVDFGLGVGGANHEDISTLGIPT
ncbi:hypothetical protein LINGRAHAP2_LOCUS14514 [Linum grandiflorum]